MTDSNKGIFIMLLGVLIIPFADALAKWLSLSLSTGQIVWIRFLFQAIFLGLFIFFFQKKQNPFKTIYIFLSLSIGASIFFLFWGLKYLPLANNIALFFIAPFVLTILSIIFLKEKVTKPIIYTLIIGFVGTLIVIRPNWSAYGIASIYPVFAGVFYALYLLIMRVSSRNNQAVNTQFWIGLIATIIVTPFLLLGDYFDYEVFNFYPIELSLWWIILLFGFIGTGVHLLIAKAFSYAKASTLASIQYLEIISATFLGYVFFNDIPDMLTFLGGVIIIFAGLNLIYFEKKSSSKLY